MATALTVGVEWEFLFGYVDGDEKDPWDGLGADRLTSLGLDQPLYRNYHSSQLERLKIYEHIKQILENEEELRRLTGGARVIAEDGPSNRHPETYDSWVIKRDHSIRPEDPDPDSDSDSDPPAPPHRLAQVELNSPIFDAPSSSSGTHAALARATRLLRRRCRLRVNGTCALQVHVGLRTAPFTALLLRKLRTLLWLAEGRLEGLCHPGRVQGSGEEALLHYARFRQFSEMAKTGDAGGGRGDVGGEAAFGGYRVWTGGVLEGLGEGVFYDMLRGRVRLLWRDDGRVTVKDVARLLCAYDDPLVRRLAFNFQGIYDQWVGGAPGDALGKKETVEFRLMEGTLNPDTVTNWVQVCTQIVRWAVESKPEEFQAVLAKLIGRSEDYTVFELLADLGCDTHTTIQHFFDKREDHFDCCNHSPPETGDFVPARCPKHG